VKTVVILGRGGAGKSTLARRLGEITGLPVVTLDELYWQPGLVAPGRERWTAIQRELVQQDRWIMDGDLGPGDVPGVRLQAADTVIVLDFSFLRCAWRAIRRSPERADFWMWLWAYRRRSLPLVREAIATHARGADLHVLRTPRAVGRFTAQARRHVRR
jgi:cytidylate kinase